MASSTAAKRKLSWSTDGKAIKVVQTATAWDTIHTAVAWTTAGTYDEIWLWATNNHTEAVNLTLERGTATAADGNIQMSIPSKTWLYLVVPWLILQNGMVVKAFAATTNVILISGFVNSCIDV